MGGQRGTNTKQELVFSERAMGFAPLPLRGRAGVLQVLGGRGATWSCKLGEFWESFGEEGETNRRKAS